MKNVTRIFCNKYVYNVCYNQRKDGGVIAHIMKSGFSWSKLIVEYLNFNLFS